VTPVVVIWGDFEQGVVGEGPTYVAGKRLVEWLVGRPRTIAQNRLAQIVGAVDAAWPLSPP